jgi:hypothetical protein
MVVTVVAGVAMRVVSGFRVDGALELHGMLRVI